MPLQISELTILSAPARYTDDTEWRRNNYTDWTTTPEGEQAQAEYGEALYTVLYSHPAVNAITWWDLTDYGAWQNAPAGMLRADMSPKPLYQRLYELVWQEWATHVCGQVLRGSELTVDCAAGDHAIDIQMPCGRALQGQFTVPVGYTGTVQVSLA